MVVSCPIHMSPPQGGSTPLHLAAEKAKVDAVRTLLSYSPNTQLKDMVSYMEHCRGRGGCVKGRGGNVKRCGGNVKGRGGNVKGCGGNVKGRGGI